MRGLFDAEIVECPYNPPGFVTMQDARGIVVADLNRGTVYRIPTVELNKIAVEIRTSWRLKNG